jgi:carboxymethylenebutenolidase
MTSLKVTIPGKGEFSGYLAMPSGPVKGLAVVVMEIYGVNREIRRMTDEMARQGYAAFAPDLLWHVGENLDFDYADRDNARKAVMSLDQAAIVTDIVAAAHGLRAHVPGGADAPLALVSAGWGGWFMFQAANDAAASAIVSYYPGNIDGVEAMTATVSAPMQFHFARHDERTKPEFRTRLRKLLADRDDVEIFVYHDADHGFANRDRTEFHAPSAELADARAAEFLARTMHMA